MAARRSNDRYLPGIALPDSARRDRDARGRRRRHRSSSSRRRSRRCPPWRASSRLPARVRRSSGCRRASSSFRRARRIRRASLSRTSTSAPMWERTGRRDLGAELRRRGRARIADGGGGRARPTPRSPPTSRRCCARKRCAPTKATISPGVEVGGAVKNVLAIAAGAERRSRLRPQRARRAHHARTRGDRPPRRRAGRPARNDDGPCGTGRPRADLHRRPVAQSPRRACAGAQGNRCRTSWPSWGTSPRASAPRRQFARLSRQHRRRDARSATRSTACSTRASHRGMRCCVSSSASRARNDTSRRSLRHRACLPSRESVLPPGLVDGDSDGVGQIEAAHARPHRDPERRIGREESADVIGQAGRLATEHQDVLRLKARCVER